MYNFDVMDISELTQAMQAFVKDKGWYQPDSPRPQTPKNLALSLCIESAEVLELFQWDDQTANPDLLAGELADVALYLLQLASVANINLEEAILEKLRINAQRTWDQDLLKKRFENDKEN